MVYVEYRLKIAHRADYALTGSLIPQSSAYHKSSGNVVL